MDNSISTNEKNHSSSSSIKISDIMSDINKLCDTDNLKLLKNNRKKLLTKKKSISIDNNRRESSRVRKKKHFKCECCEISFSKKKNIKRHIRKNHNNLTTANESADTTNTNAINTNTGTISKVNKEQLSQLNLDNLCNKEGKYECKLCNKIYTHERSLILHNRLHTGQDLFACSYCDKKFYANHHLTEHIRTHTGEKPFVCDLCNRSFAQRSSLGSHYKTIEHIKAVKNVENNDNNKIMDDLLQQSRDIDEQLNNTEDNDDDPLNLVNNELIFNSIDESNDNFNEIINTDSDVIQFIESNNDDDNILDFRFIKYDDDNESGISTSIDIDNDLTSSNKSKLIYASSLFSNSFE